MTPSMPVHSFSRDEILSNIDALADILANCVNGGASVSFMAPFSHQDACAFWLGVAESVERQERTVLVCRDPHGALLGTVQLLTDQPENQPHRADVAKLLVHEKARRRGVAMALMEALEAAAREQGKTVLVLDTASGSGAESFYVRGGWIRVGEIPDYALMPDGEMTATTVFYKFL